MIFAMHQIQVQCLLVSAHASKWYREFLRRVADQQLLLASATTEKGMGGDILSSSCAVETSGNRIMLRKLATVISYGRHADAILITARRAPESLPSDQVLVAALKGQYKLEPNETWDSLGMRGTCSEGFLITMEGLADQICPMSFADIAGNSMLGTSHIFWSGVWHGIATDAVARAQAFARDQARQNPRALPVGSVRLAEAVERLQLMRLNIVGAIDLYVKALENNETTESMRFRIAMNNLKVNTSQLLVDIVTKALLVCGLAGYRNDSRYSLCRHLRDAYSAPLMINNDRIERNVAGMLLMSKLDDGLTA
jgi:acyl-CoA dehydrogenase